MRVLLAVDGSPHSQLAVDAFAERPWPDGTIVRVLTVSHAAVPLAIDPAFVAAAAHVVQTARTPTARFMSLATHTAPSMQRRDQRFVTFRA
jgi:hypothetical protein